MTETLTIRIEDAADYEERVADKLAAIDAGEDVDERYVLSLPDEEALARVLSDKNLELIRTIAAAKPESVRALAREVNRDIKNVSEAITELTELGVVEIEQDGRAKRPTVWYDELEVKYQLPKPDVTDDDATAAS